MKVSSSKIPRYVNRQAWFLKLNARDAKEERKKEKERRRDRNFGRIDIESRVNFIFDRSVFRIAHNLSRVAQFNSIAILPLSRLRNEMEGQKAKVSSCHTWSKA